eukprot:CAMPEP_0168369340 /NCGR_PEP_ID=MMETSP0228-20121227/6707_1 /TAXON_ID=133427 /ORGANISM="Protoceratium reticulatum, Strain CCCM 535 (=CCMP 1889)" /LENGTH=179 /DNA_ID=CAMNT_0008382197 /DNA_START=8 /DNA_END=545 /DNA_ORIENTATION=+
MRRGRSASEPHAHQGHTRHPPGAHDLSMSVVTKIELDFVAILGAVPMWSRRRGPSRRPVNPRPRLALERQAQDALELRALPDLEPGLAPLDLPDTFHGDVGDNLELPQRYPLGDPRELQRGPLVLKAVRAPALPRDGGDTELQGQRARRPGSSGYVRGNTGGGSAAGATSHPIFSLTGP